MLIRSWGGIGTLLAHNLFSYCRNNPVSRHDAQGTDDEVSDIIGVGHITEIIKEDDPPFEGFTLFGYNLVGYQYSRRDIYAESRGSSNALFSASSFTRAVGNDLTKSSFGGIFKSGYYDYRGSVGLNDIGGTASLRVNDTKYGITSNFSAQKASYQIAISTRQYKDNKLSTQIQYKVNISGYAVLATIVPIPILMMILKSVSTAPVPAYN